MAALFPAFLLAYSLQLAIVVAALWVGVRVLASRSAMTRLRVWQAALVLAVALPAGALLPVVPAPSGEREAFLSIARVSIESPDGAAPQAAWPSWLAIGLIAGAALRAAWIGVGWVAMRRRFAAARSRDDARFAEVCSAVGVRARLIWRTDVSHPFTYGSTAPVVVVPADLASASEATLRAIFTHELMHIRRGDWRSVIVEEVIRTALWFHPAIWLLLGELHQAREEVIDRATVRLVGSRRSYLETLVALADRGDALPLAAALPFFKSRQLARRIAALASEAPMSRLRIVTSSVVLVAASAVTLAAAARTFPLPAISADDLIQGQAGPTASAVPGPIEQTAVALSPEVPAPRRTVYVAPELPALAARLRDPEFEVRVVVNAEGQVAEARMLTIKASTSDKAQSAQLAEAVLKAVRRWQFERPARAPLAFTVTLVLEPASGGGQAASTERPVVIEMKKAEYPASALAKKLQGEVALDVSIDEQGKVTGTRVVKPLAPELDAAAAAALGASTFRPGMKDGRPVPVTVTITVAFRLK
jgi:TonB family protein